MSIQNDERCKQHNQKYVTKESHKNDERGSAQPKYLQRKKKYIYQTIIQNSHLGLRSLKRNPSFFPAAIDKSIT